MDKYNVIVPTNNLNDLDKDMEQWAFMPYDLRKRSDEDCIRLYGCTNTDLYKRLKSQILSGEEQKQMDEENKESNLVRESVTAEEILNGINNPEDTLAMSKKLQESPYIVIIDPIVDNMEELNYRFDCFNRLSSKDRRLSNMHSYDLWKYDVYNMHAIVKAAIENKDAAKAEPSSSNLVKEAAVVYSTNVVLEKYENNLYRNNFIEACALKYNLYKQFSTVVANESAYNNYERFYSAYVFNKCDDIFEEFTSFDTYILPKVTPWLTQKELNENNIKLNVENFSYGNLINVSDDELLQYGWSKYYKPTEKNALKEARERQADYIKSHCPIVVNTEGYNITEDTIESNTDLGCIYLIINKIPNGPIVAEISFDCKESFTFMTTTEGFKGFVKGPITSNTSSIDIYAVPMKKEIIDLIRYNIDNTDDYSDISRFAFDILKNVSNRESLDAIKVIIMRYLEILVAIANMNDPNKPYNLYTNNGCDYSKIYKLYSGPVSLIDYNSINTLVYDIINDKFGINYAKQLLNDTDTNDSNSNDTTNDTSKDQFIEMIKTRSVIL